MTAVPKTVAHAQGDTTMVAVIAGNGLGLGNTSLKQLGQAQGGQASIGQAQVNQYLNVATGNLVLQSQDEGLVFDGLPLDVLRTYNSQGQLNGSAGWMFGFGQSISGLSGAVNTAGSSVVRTDADGSSVTYVYDASRGLYVSSGQSGAEDTLAWNAGTSSWSWTDGSSRQQETYNAGGQLTTLSNEETGANYSFSYSNGLLSQIAAGDGDTLLFGYNTNGQLISLSIQEVPPGQTAAVTRQQVSYGYDAQGRLSTVTTTLASDTDNSTASYTTTYTYDGSSDRVASVSQSDGTTVSYTYTEDSQGAYQVTGITTGSGAAAQTVALSYGAGSTTVTDALGHATTYQYNAAGELAGVVAPAVNGSSPTTSYSYDSNGNLLTATDPDGAVTRYQYDANGNLLSVEDGQGNTVSYTYNADDQVTSKTTYTVPAQGAPGQSGYVAPTGAQTTYYVYNANDQLAYTVDPLGQVSENDYTTSGTGLSQLTTTRQYLGASYDIGTLSPAAPPTLAALLAWTQSGAVQATLGHSSRTDYSYDARGQLASKTQWDAVDASGNGVLDSGTVVTTTTYDAQGRLLQTATQTGANHATPQTTSYAYDGLGRLIASTDPLGHATTYLYNDSANTLAITQANGLVTTQVRNSAGLLVSSTQSATSVPGQDGGTSTSSIADQVNLTIDDAQGRPMAQLEYRSLYLGNATTPTYGEFVTTASYDSNGNLVGTTTYAVPLTAKQVAMLQSNPTWANLQSMLTPSANDQATLTIYDDQHRLVAQVATNAYIGNQPVNGDFVTTTSYDASGNVIETRLYATPLTALQAAALMANPTVGTLQAMLASSAQDEVTLSIYDSQNRQVGGVSYQFLKLPNGQNGAWGEYASVTSYDANGKVVGTTQYATPLTSDQVTALQSNLTLANLESTVPASSNDQVTLSIYDQNGNQVAGLAYQALQGANPPVYGEYAQIGSRTYATALNATQIGLLQANPTLDNLQSMVVGGADDRLNLTIYDNQGRTQARVGYQTLQINGNLVSGDFVTEYLYGAQGTGTVLYATPLTETQISSLQNDASWLNLQPMLTPSTYDQLAISISDGAGNSATIGTSASLLADDSLMSGLGAQFAGGMYIMAQTQSGSIYNTSLYGTPLSLAQITSLENNPTWATVQSMLSPSNNDIHEMSFNDSTTGQSATVAWSLGTSDSDGSPVSAVTVDYTSNNASIGSATYTNSLTAADITSLQANATMANLQPMLASSSNYQVGIQVSIAGFGLLTVAYQNAGQSITGQPGEYVTQVGYNSSGLTIGSITYAHALTAAQALSLLENPTLDNLNTMLVHSSADQVSINIYDSHYRVVAQISSATLPLPGNGSQNGPSGIYVTLTSFAANGEMVGSTILGTPITTAQAESLFDNPTSDHLQSIINADGLANGGADSETTQFIYNAAGQEVATIDPAGNVSYTFYDADGRVSGTVDANGAVTAYTYDADGRVTQTTQYGTTIDPSSWISNGALTSSYPAGLPLPASTGTDRTSTTIYDAAGEKVATIDPAGYATVTRYDGDGNVVAVTQYATALTSSLGSAPTLANLQVALTTSAADRTTQTIYDADQRPVATIDAAGYVVTLSYDANDEVVQQTAYATALTAKQLGELGDAPSLSTLQADLATSVQDQTTRSYYDGTGRLVAQVDADGYLTVTSYDTETNTTTTTRYATALSIAQLGALTGAETTADLVGLLGSSTANEQSSVTYDADDQVVSRTAADGTVTTYQYNSVGQVLSATITPASGQGAPRTTSATYDAFGNLLTSTDASGATTTYTYNALNQRTEATDVLGNSTWYSYDADGQLVYAVQGQPSGGALNALGNVTAYAYNAFGQVATTTVYAAQLTLNTAAGDSGSTLNPGTATLTQVAAAVAALPASANDANATSSTTYDARGQVATVTDGDGYLTAYQYDAFGDRTQVQQQIIAPGSALSAANSTTRTYGYDSRGELIVETDGVGTAAARSTGNTYDAFGRVSSSTDGNGNVIQYSYDHLGRQLASSQTVDGQLRTTQASYDAYGRVVSQTDALGNVTTYQYDLATHTTTVTTPLGVTSQTVRDAYGDTVSVADGAGNATSYTYDGDSRLLTSTDALGATSSNQYDADGNLIRSTDAAGQVVTYTYDASGRVLSKTVDPTGQALTTSYAYDGAGRLLSMTDPMGVATTYSYYDADGNVLSEMQDAGTGEINLTTTYTYDGAGNVLTKTLGSGATTSTTQYVYDALGQLVQSIVDPAGLKLTTSYAYDANGNPVASTDPNGNTTYTIYDQANEAVYTITPAGAQGAGEGVLTQHWYDADGRLVATRTYDSLVAIGSLSNLAGGSVAGNLAAGASLATGAATANDPISYNLYDADGRLRYSIDALGEVIETRYNALGQVAETLAYATPITLTAALDGALRAGTAQASDMQQALSNAGDSDATARVNYAYYDADGRQVYSITPKLVNGTLAAVVSQTQYDADGRVIARSVYGVPLALSAVGGSATTASIAQAVAQANTPATTQTTQIIYNAAGEQVAQVDPNGNPSFTFYDKDGRVVVTVSTSGAVVKYTRDALGRVTEQYAYIEPAQTSGWLVNGAVTVTAAQALPQAYQFSDRITLTTYDAMGRVATTTRYAQVASTETYDPTTGQVTVSYNYSGGDTLTYSYDAASRVVEQQDDGFYTEAASASNGYVATPESSTRTTRLFYDADGNTIGTLDANGYLTTEVYDAAGQRTQTTAYATVTNAALQATGTLAQLTPASSASDQITSNYYDAQGNLLGTLDADGYFTQYTYDLDDQRLSTTRYATAVSGSATASLTSILSALAGTAAQQTLNSYDAYGDLLSQTNPQGVTTQYSYDPAGQVVQTTVAAGTADARTSSASYDAFGNQLSSTDAMGRTTTYAYDLDGNRTLATDALGNKTWYVYYPDGQLYFTIRGVADSNGNSNALGEVSETAHDVFGDLGGSYVFAARITIGSGFTPTSRSMSALMSPILVADINESANADHDRMIGYSYDLEGRVTSESVNYSSFIQDTYDGFGDVVLAQSGDGNYYDALTTTYTYDNMGDVTGQVDAGQYYGGQLRTQSWTYDAFGNKASYTDGDGSVTTYTYDNLDQQLSQSLTVQGQARTTSTRYDAYGRVLSSTDAMGLVTSYAYDDAARTLTVTAPGGLTTVTAYNREGQTIAVTDPAGNTTRYQYDADGELQQTIQADGGTVTNAYDNAGNLTQTTDADGHVVAYTYDAAGRVLTQTVDPNGLKLVTTYVYDGRGLKVAVTDPTGIVTTYAYDGNGNVLERVQDAGTASTHQNLTTDYTYNRYNEVTKSVSQNGNNGNGESDYTYDSLGRLTSELLDTGGIYNSIYSYDPDGNLISTSNGDPGGVYNLYNEAGELIYQIDQDAGGFGEFAWKKGLVTQYSYNADGQVVAKRQYATALSASQINAISNAIDSDDGLEAQLSNAAAQLTTSVDDHVSYQVYNANGQLQYSIDPTGAVTETLYNSAGQVSGSLAYAAPISVSSSLASALQAATATPADVQSALTAAGDSDATARATYTYYDDMGRVSLVVSSASLGGQSGGLVQQTQYDADGNVIAQIQYGALLPASQFGAGATTASIESYLAGVSAQHTTRSVYDAAGRKVYQIDAAGNVTQTEYDADGRASWTLQYAHPIGTPAGWDAVDVAAAVQAANPDTTQMRGTGNVYDSVGNLVETLSTQSSTPTAKYTYDARGLKLSYTDGNGNTWQYAYDEAGNLSQETSPLVAVASYGSDGSYQGTVQASIVTTYEYANDGTLSSKTVQALNAQGQSLLAQGVGITNYQYDSDGNLFEVQLSGPGAVNPSTGVVTYNGNPPTTTISYDAFGHAVASEDANGNDAYNVYDLDGRLAYAVDGDGYVTGYQYNAYGQQTAVTRYAEPIDTSALVSSQSWVPGQPLSMEQLQSSLDPSSADRTITTTYDIQGNKLSVTQPAITYTNSNGSASSGSPVTQYTYDAYGNVTSQSLLVQGTPGQAGAVWATSYYYYDALGHQTMAVDPLGYVTSTTYDAFGDVSSTTQWATAIGTGGLVAGGAPPALPPAGNAATTGLDRVTQYTYDNNGNKTGESVLRSYINAQGQPVTGFVTTSYGYDGDNHVTTVTENGNTVITAYDALGRIISVTGPQVQVLVANWQALLEANPSLTLASPSLYTTAAQVVSYSYDALGNKLVQTVGSTGSTQSVSTYYQYDANGHAVAELTPLDGSAPNWTSNQARFMAYDANGNLISQSYTLTGNDTTSTTVTTNYSYDADNQQIASITWRSSIPSPDAATSTTYDAFGEVVASGDGVVNNVVTTYDNDGNKLTSTDPKTGELHTYGYNLAGQLLTDTVPLAASVGGTAQTIYTRDLDGRAVAEQGPSTNAASGESSGIVHASYDAWGNVLSSTDANGNTTTYTYNERNDIVVETEAAVAVVGIDGSSTTTTPVKTAAYDADGNLVASTDENGNVTRTVYNALGQVVQTSNGAGATSLTGYDALGNQVAGQDGNGNLSFTNVDALGRTVQQGSFVLAAAGNSRQLVWRQAYVLDQNGDHIISYDGIGSAYLQGGDGTDAALHATFDGYDSQKRVIWSQDAAQRAASSASAHGLGNYGTGSWTQQPTNPNFAQGSTGWTLDPGFIAGSYSVDGQSWGMVYTGTNNPNGGEGTAVNQDKVPVVPGQTITAHGHFDVVGEHGGGAIGIVWYDANGNALPASEQPSNNDIVSAGNGPGVSALTATAPPGAAYAAIVFGCTNYNIGSAIYISNVSWTYVPPAYITSVGTGNGGVVVSLPSGSFTDQPTNQDFEQGAAGWNLGTGWSVVQASNAANGKMVGAYGGPGINSMINQDRVPVVAGQTISASVDVSLYLAPFLSQAAGAVLIVWYDANGNQIGVSEGNVVASDHKGAWVSSNVTASAPAGAAFAAIGVSGNASNGGGLEVDAARWNYQYVPQVPTGVVQNTYVYNQDGQLVSETTADGDTESWQYNAYGQVTQHTDLNGANYTYSYDANTGAETGESDNWSPTGQTAMPGYVSAPITTPNSETLTYNANGQVATETFADGSSYSYQYDANGNLIREEDLTHDGNDKLVHTVTQTSYDSHNRISQVVQTDEVTGAVVLDENFSYDAAGNRREVSASSHGSTQAAWYTYDGDNRVMVSDGTLQNGQIVVSSAAASYENFYDANGNVVQILTLGANGDSLVQRNHYDAYNELVQADYAVDTTTGGASDGVQQLISYDADGHALVTQTYYALDATIQVQQPGNPNDPNGNGSQTETVNVGGQLESATVNFYDAVGRLSESQTFGNPSNWDGTGGAAPTTPPTPDATTYGSLQLQSEVVYQGPNGTPGYDAEGNVVGYQYRDSSGRVDQYQVFYLKKDSYLQANTTGSNISGTANVQPATTTVVYDTRGNQVAVEQHTEDPSGTIDDTVHVFAYNGQGEIIERQDGTGSSGSTLDQGSSPATEVQHYVYANGQQLAHFDDAGTLDVLDEVTAFSSNNNSPDSYVVQTGDTLQSIAQMEYGNASLWYVLAQANGLSGDSSLALGQRLFIPAVTTHSNTSNTFAPYNPGSILGNTTPSLPSITPPPTSAPSSANCNVLAEIVVVAVTIVVTVLTYGATSELLYGEAAALTAGEAATVGAIAGAAGSVAGQLTGEAEGIQHGFNWGGVLEGAIGGAIGAGVTTGLSQSATFASSTSANGLNVGGDLVQGAASYLGNDIAAKLSGQSAHFSWAGLVAGSVASVASGEIGPTQTQSMYGQAGDSSELDRVFSAATGDVVDRELADLLGDAHLPSWTQVGEDIAGYAIGEPVGSYLSAQAQQGIQAYQAQQSRQEVDALNTSADQYIADQQSSIQVSEDGQTAAMAQQDFAGMGQSALDGQGAGQSSSQIAQLQSMAQALRDSIDNPSMDSDAVDRATAALSQALDDVQAGSVNAAQSVAQARSVVSSAIGQPVGDVNTATGAINVDIYGGRSSQSDQGAYTGQAGWYNTDTDVLTGNVNGMAGSYSTDQGSSAGNELHGPGWAQRLGYAANNVLTGAVDTLINIAYQPVAQVHDLSLVAYGLVDHAITGEIYQPDYWSNTGQEAVTDRDPSDHMVENLLASNPVTGSAVFGWNLGTAISNGDAKSVETQLGGLFGALALGKVGLEGEPSPSLSERIDPTLSNESLSSIDPGPELGPRLSGDIGATDPMESQQPSVDQEFKEAGGGRNELEPEIESQSLDEDTFEPPSSEEGADPVEGQQPPVDQEFREVEGGRDEVDPQISPLGSAKADGVGGANEIGIPAARATNPLSPVLEYDAQGNEIYYRAMRNSNYRALVENGRLTGTGETSLAPLEAYSSGYRGVLVRLTTRPGTSAQLQEIGIAANEPASAQFPNMSTRTGAWSQTNARFKVEATGVMNINEGLGIMNTQIGKGAALDIFNDNLLRFERLN